MRINKSYLIQKQIVTPDQTFFKITLLIFFVVLSCPNTFATLITYGSPGDLSTVPHLKQSSDYTVTVNGKSSFVYETDNSWDGGGVSGSMRMQKKAAFTNFDFLNETVNVEVTCNFTVNSVTIRPKIDNIAFTQTGNKISFSLSSSKYLSIEVNDRLNPLFLFADSVLTPPTTDITYGPGIHNIGTKCPVPANTSIYIAGGAVVVGSFLGAGDNIKIYGKGVLNCGSVLSAEWLLDKLKSPLAADSTATSFGYEMHGFTIVNSPGWHVNAYGNEQMFSNLKCIAWAGMTDAPHLTNKSLMRHCFIFNNDDALICNQGSNANFKDCVVWKGPYGRCMISLQNNSQSNILWEDIDVIGNESPLNQLKAKMIAIVEVTSGTKTNYTFRNIRIEGQLENKAGFFVIDAQGTSIIKNVILENITTELLRTTAADIEGTINKATTAKIDGVHFKCVRMNGTLITSLAQAQIGNPAAALNVNFVNAACINTDVEEVNESIESNNMQFYSSNGKLKYNMVDVNIKTVNIFNSMGAKVKSGKIENIDIDNLPVGVYHINAEADGANYAGKFLKQ